jgi:colanic acid biosynthesis glycosyl transferase WcaI
MAHLRMARLTLLNQYYAPDEAATAQLASDLGATLSASGHDVTAIASNRSYATEGRKYGLRDVIGGVTVHRIPSTALGRNSLFFRVIDYGTFFVGAARELLLGPRPDLVIVLTTPPLIGVLVLFAAKLRHFRILLWSMDVYPDVAFAIGTLRPNSIAGRILTAASRSVVRGADTIVAVGESMELRLREQGASDLEVIHNWADEETVFPRPIAGHSLRQQWGWAGRFVVLYSGNLGLAHEFETVLNAARVLAETVPNVLFAFIGSGPRTKEVQNASRGFPNVQFQDLVPRSKLSETLTAADIHLITLRPQMAGVVVPSKIYGILAAGRPAIYVGPLEGEIYEIINQGLCGTAISNDDVMGLVDAIAAYADDSNKTAREGQNGRRLFESRFTKRAGTEAFLRLVERTLDQDSA